MVHTKLHDAVLKNDLNKVKEAVSEGIDINEQVSDNFNKIYDCSLYVFFNNKRVTLLLS